MDEAEPAEIMGGLYGDGIIAPEGRVQHATSPIGCARISRRCSRRPGRCRAERCRAGRERFYVEVQPERIRGFVEIVTHPWFVAVCEAVLGPDYRIVEIGFDIPFPGAADQPWHRDFAVPEATTKGRRLNSLAFNLTAVDTRPEHGPFEIAPGTQWDQFEGCPRGMFPPRELWPRYIERAVPKLPQRGDISARSALTVHRGTANRSERGAAGARGRSRRARRDQRRPSRSAGHPRLRANACRRASSTISPTGWSTSWSRSSSTM